MSQTIQFYLTSSSSNDEGLSYPNLGTKDLPRDYVELCNLLKLVGLADSGGRGKTMVAEGIVKVDGVIELRKTAKIRAGQKVYVAEHTIHVIG